MDINTFVILASGTVVGGLYGGGGAMETKNESPSEPAIMFHNDAEPAGAPLVAPLITVNSSPASANNQNAINSSAGGNNSLCHKKMACSDLPWSSLSIVNSVVVQKICISS